MGIYPKCGMREGFAVIDNGTVGFEREAGAPADAGECPCDGYTSTFAP